MIGASPRGCTTRANDYPQQPGVDAQSVLTRTDTLDTKGALL